MSVTTLTTVSRRAVSSATGLVLAATGLVAFAASPSYAAGPTYQMPFGCGQSWLGSTRAGHSPSTLAIDWTHGGSTHGQPVLASADGTISIADTLTNSDGSYRSYGKYVVIDHGGGWKTLYAHLDDYNVTEGARISRGQQIGHVGNTGNSSGAHLHYEQKYDGQVKQATFNGSPFNTGNLTSKNCDTAPEQPPAAPKQWRAQVAVESGGGIYHGVRNADRTWTAFGDVESQGGEVPTGVRSISESGIDGDTHVLAVSNEGKLYHTIRFADQSWGGFRDVHAVAGPLTNVTQVTSASIGGDLHVAVVADGSVYHTIRYANGTWALFGKVDQPAGGAVTKVAIAGSGSNLQMAALTGGVLQHTVRKADGSWTAWGNVSVETGAAAAGITSIDDVALASTGAGDLQLVVAANGGTKQFHGARYGNGTWTGFNDLGSVVSGVTVTDVAAAQVDGEMQAAFVATDGRILHTIRHTDGTWSAAGSVDLTGVSGDHTGIAITGTYN
ncbi:MULTISPECIES: M23 family metallopeptidase [unclassified Streptomyces]|uniref:M23 family metallopeptidase n=1 Tax=unclassified Streptomyces TaxID=2593676 RepID=UPI00225C1934|nr:MULTISPECIES: M23 family metallopeptidase [unclassified Streptomyces]MCX4528173.1 M23 family metallopeptidase [Streptomyces sp. NBC_01551]MCX4541227.1 M23 family metallopeptidase [Streptomyces sp. NBC_01565]